MRFIPSMPQRLVYLLTRLSTDSKNLRKNSDIAISLFLIPPLACHKLWYERIILWLFSNTYLLKSLVRGVIFFLSQCFCLLGSERKGKEIWLYMDCIPAWNSMNDFFSIRKLNVPSLNLSFLSSKPERMIFITYARYSLRNYYFPDCFLLELELRKVTYARMECLKEYSKTISRFLNRHMQMLFHMCCEIRPNMCPHCSSVWDSQ